MIGICTSIKTMSTSCRWSRNQSIAACPSMANCTLAPSPSRIRCATSRLISLSSTTSTRTPTTWLPWRLTIGARPLKLPCPRRRKTSATMLYKADPVTGLVNTPSTWSMLACLSKSSRENAVTINTTGDAPGSQTLRIEAAAASPSMPGIFQSINRTSKFCFASSLARTFCTASAPDSALVALHPMDLAVSDRFSSAISLSSAINMSNAVISGALAVRSVVVHANGIVNQNSLPCPTPLMTPISPPIMVTRWRQMDRPKPVPP